MSIRSLHFRKTSYVFKHKFVGLELIDMTYAACGISIQMWSLFEHDHKQVDALHWLCDYACLCVCQDTGS